MFILFKSFLKALGIAGVLTFLIAGTAYTRLSGTEVEMEKLKIEPRPTVIYDKNGDILAQFLQDRKSLTQYEELPEEIVEAVIATEDREFFEHSGINVKAIARAAYIDIKAGAFVQGGSTITQQLVKTIYLNSGKTLERKQKEAIYAAALEQTLSKEEIITYYLNHIFFGHRSYGIKNAVTTYFDQTLDEFNQGDRVDRIAKAAFLAGLPQAPSAYSPYMNPEGAMQRRNTVIQNMKNQGYITEAEYREAIKKPFLVLDIPNDVHDDEKVKYPEFVHYVLQEASEKLDTSLEGAKYSGSQIYTSFDPNVYEILRKHLSNSDLYPRNASDGTQVQGGMVLLNPKNGEIYALTGGRTEPEFLGFNRAFHPDMKRQPGSSFKPIISYGPAIESGKFTPSSILVDDQSYNFGGGYRVKNFGGKQRGKISMLDAITISENVPAVYLLEKVGIDYAVDYAAKLGVDLSQEKSGLSMALGGLELGVNPLQMADAYQAYANGGYRIPAHTIRKLMDFNGDPVYESPKFLTEEYRVIKPKTAEYMKYMMRNVVEKGTATNAKVSGHFMAGKTGTTEYPGLPGRNKDIWFTGFSETFVGSVWMGFDDPSQVRSLGDTSWVTAKMFGAVAKDMLELYPSPIENYEQPEDVKKEVKSMEIFGTLQENKVSISWKSEKGKKYEVVKNGEVLEKEVNNSYIDFNLEAGKTYTYQVIGYDSESEEKVLESNTLTFQVGEKKEDEKKSDTDTAPKPVSKPSEPVKEPLPAPSTKPPVASPTPTPTNPTEPTNPDETEEKTN